MHDAGQCGLVGFQFGVVARQGVRDAGNLGAVRPDFAHAFVDYVGGGLKHLLHRQRGRQVTGVVDAEPGHRHFQIFDRAARTQQRAVGNLDDAGGDGGVVFDDFGHGRDIDIGVARNFAHLQRHFRQGGQNKLVVVEGVQNFLADLLDHFAHGLDYSLADLPRLAADSGGGAPPPNWLKV